MQTRQLKKVLIFFGLLDEKLCLFSGMSLFVCGWEPVNIIEVSVIWFRLRQFLHWGYSSFCWGPGVNQLLHATVYNNWNVLRYQPVLSSFILFREGRHLCGRYLQNSKTECWYVKWKMNETFLSIKQLVYNVSLYISASRTSTFSEGFLSWIPQSGNHFSNYLDATWTHCNLRGHKLD